uniref:Uncharacterized protein n=1 Tax=Aegilops tauschii subsp. strangulata TaxID=200361 RepID=A0A453IXJ8_AEGTS
MPRSNQDLLYAHDTPGISYTLTTRKLQRPWAVRTALNDGTHGVFGIRVTPSNKSKAATYTKGLGLCYLPPSNADYESTTLKLGGPL